MKLTAIAIATVVGWAGAPAAEAPVRLPVGVDGPKVVKHVDPEYPANLIRESRGGIVVLDCVIGSDGRVEGVDLLAGTSGFEEAAIRAVRQWEFEPTTLEDKPARIAKVVYVSFFVSSGLSPEQLLNGIMRHPNPLVREAAARGLGQRGKEGVGPLTKALADENPRVRATAALGLGKIGRPAKKAVPSLKQAASDPDPTVREAASKALVSVEAD